MKRIDMSQPFPSIEPPRRQAPVADVIVSICALTVFLTAVVLAASASWWAILWLWTNLPTS